MSISKKKYFKRSWIRDDDAACIVAEVYRSPHFSKHGKTFTDAGLSISDGTRTVHFDFSTYSKEDSKRAKKSLKGMRKALDAFFDAVEREFELDA